ncbi:hypothetical protein Tco_0812354 [Tanacetum coccineum]
MLGTIMIDDQLQEDVNILEEDWSLGNARNKQLWLSPSTEVEYVAAAIVYNESTICIVKNPVFHSKTKHIQIRHHFIRDCYEQRLINVVKKTLLLDLSLIFIWTRASQQFWATASLRVINEVPHIRATVAGKKILLSEQPFGLIFYSMMLMVLIAFLKPKQLFGDNTLRDIGYEAVLVPKTTSGTNLGQKHASALMSSQEKLGTRGGTDITSPHSRAASSARDAQGTPDQSAAQASISQGTAEVQGTDNSQGTANLQGTAASQGTAAIPKSPNDYTPTDASQTSGGDEGLLDLYALNREVRRLKKQTLSQAKQIHKLKAKLKKLSKFVQPVVKHHAFWVESQNLKKRRKKQKKQKKKVSSVKLGRNKEEGTLSEEHYVQDDLMTADLFFEDIVDKDAAVTPDFERKSVETEALEKRLSKLKKSMLRRKRVLMTLIFDDEAGPSSPIRPTQNIEPEEQFKVDEVLADISGARGLSILLVPIQSQPSPQQPSQAY